MNTVVEDKPPGTSPPVAVPSDVPGQDHQAANTPAHTPDPPHRAISRDMLITHARTPPCMPLPQAPPRAQTDPSQPYRSVPYASAGTPTTFATANQRLYGMEPKPAANEIPAAAWSTQPGLPSALTGNAHQAASALPTITNTSVQDVERRLTELSNALTHRRLNPLTPYIYSTWYHKLHSSGLILKYLLIPSNIRFRFDFGICAIGRTFSSPNSTSHKEMLDKELFDRLATIIRREFSQGCYFGPFTQGEVESLLGPFQAGPLLLVSKPGKPGKYCMVQDHSFLHKTAPPFPSINSSIDSNLYPATWGTFDTICLIIAHLPPNSQAAVRDVAEAYRTVPVVPSQWPGMVVRLQGADSFAVDTNSCFGLASASGVYGELADAGADLFRAMGMGPLSKWVDDHIFFWIRISHIPEYNRLQQRWHQSIQENRGRIQEGGRLWYKGARMPDGRPEEFDEDVRTPIRDLSACFVRSQEDVLYSYCMGDIDHLLQELGIPQNPRNTIFASHPRKIQ